ncbi:MAG: HEPN domain-containing protein [Actinomycetota bacterium]
MTSVKKTRKVTVAEARDYAVKAREYLEAAKESLEVGRYNAATSMAVHAGICSADAVSGGRQGVRSAAPDHSQTVKLVGSAGKDGAEAAKHLRRLLPLKTRAEYDPKLVSRKQAEEAIRSAERLVGLAESVIASLG